MSEVLKVLHLAQQHGVAQVQVRRSRIEADLDGQRLTGRGRRSSFARSSPARTTSTQPLVR